MGTVKWVVLVALLLPVVAFGQEAAPEKEPTDAPEASALYDLMVATMRKAKTLAWTSVYRSGSSDYGQLGRCVYRIWLKKPNHVRLEASYGGDVKGILVGDGSHFWTYWPPGRPQYGHEREGEGLREYRRTKDISYLKKRSPPGAHSISHETGKLGAGLGMTILDPSTFHGYTDSLQRYIDGVTHAGTEKVKDEDCDVIDVSIMKGQRTWRLWLARRDHLPRRLEQKVFVRSTLTTRETWTKVRIDEEIPDEKFAWKPPEGWVEFRRPSVSEGLLKTGTTAPDFDLPLHGGGRFKLADKRGKVVWINVWRAG